MAKKTKGASIVYWILLVVFVAGLGGFGVHNFGGATQSVASVGDTEIGFGQYARALQAQMRAQTDAAGKPMTMAEAQASGLDRQVLQQLLAQAALSEAANQAGLSVGDEAVREQILAIPAFQGAGGQFDRSTYEMMLKNNGMTAEGFEGEIRGELARNLLQAALAVGVLPQPGFADSVVKFLTETAAVTYAPVDATTLGAPVAAPSADEVAAFYTAHPDLFRIPERKEITYAWLTPAMVAGSVALDEAELRAAYDARKDDFSRPAMRMVDRLGFPDEAAAAAAKARIDTGETSFDGLLSERGLTIDDVDLGTVEESDLGEAGASVFALEDTGVVGPLPSAVGPALFRVNAIMLPQETPFEEARTQLSEELGLERAAAELHAQREPLEDRLAGGATLEDLAADSPMEIGTITWTGTEDQGIAGYEGFRTAAAAASLDDYPEIAELEDGTLFALRVDKVIPAEVPPLADVQAKAAELALAEATATAVAEKATAVAAQISEGGDFASLGLTPQTLTGISRRSVVTQLPPGAMDTVFGLEPGKATVVSSPEASLVVRLDGITPPDPATPGVDQLRQALDTQAAQAIASDLLTAVAQSVETGVGVTVNEAAINAVQSRLP